MPFARSIASSIESNGVDDHDRAEDLVAAHLRVVGDLGDHRRPDQAALSPRRRAPRAPARASSIHARIRVRASGVDHRPDVGVLVGGVADPSASTRGTNAATNAS